MLNQLLNNPAYLRLYKNATSLDAGEIPKVPANFIPTIPATVPMIISEAKPTIAPPTNVATVINSAPPKNKGGGNLLLFIGVGLVVGIAAYSIYDHYNQKNKPIKI